MPPHRYTGARDTFGFVYRGCTVVPAQILFTSLLKKETHLQVAKRDLYRHAHFIPLVPLVDYLFPEFKNNNANADDIQHPYIPVAPVV